MYWIVLAVVSAALVAIDQITKLVAIQQLAGRQSIPVINGVVELTYVENRGVAWGMMQNKQWIVIVVTSVMLLFVAGVLASRRLEKSRTATIGGVLIFAGGIGNLIDRIFRGFVVDFIHYFKWFDFPVFNFADCCVSIGAVLILIYAFFFSETKDTQKEEPLDGTVPLHDPDGKSGDTP